MCVIVIGGTTYPLYSVAGAYANDWLPRDRITAAAGQLVLLYGVGAMIGPLIGSALMARIGTDGFVWMAVVCHLAIAAFLLIRMVQYAGRSGPSRGARWRWPGGCSTSP